MKTTTLKSLQVHDLEKEVIGQKYEDGMREAEQDLKEPCE